MSRTLPEKPCAVCGRRITWRKKWAASWDEVRYCSDACRRAKGRDRDVMETTILDILSARAAGGSICPSEAARQVHPQAWREHMEEARQAARRLVARGEAEITQKGRPVDPSSAKGPIRVRLTRRNGSR